MVSAPESLQLDSGPVGPLEPDLFATAFNTKISKFVPGPPHPQAEAVDAIPATWSMPFLQGLSFQSSCGASW